LKKFDDVLDDFEVLGGVEDADLGSGHLGSATAEHAVRPLIVSSQGDKKCRPFVGGIFSKLRLLSVLSEQHG